MTEETADLTVREVAARLKVHPETVRVWLRQGVFPNAYQLPRRADWRIPRADVHSIVEDGQRRTPTEP
jgi:excisionase family DNA binding protein